MDEKFRETFDIKEKTVKFNTHEELDDFTNNLLKVDCEFQFKYKSEWNLLKSFDRYLFILL
jgi:hypothetical protein